MAPPIWWNSTWGMSALKGGARAFSYLPSNGIVRTLDQGANSAIPNVLIDPQSAFDMYYKFGLDDIQLKTALSYHGISLQPELGNNNFHHYWQRYLKYNEPWPTVNECIDMFYRGYINLADLEEYLKRAGVRGELWRKYLKELSTPLDVDTIRYNYFQGQLTPAQVYEKMSMLGYRDINDISKLIDRSAALDPGGIILLRNREYFDDARFDNELKRAGYTSKDDQDAWRELLKQIPSPSDLIQFALKEGWDDAIVQKFGYDDEFPKTFQLWMDRQGFGWNSESVAPDGTLIKGPTWPELYWRSHWSTISAGQAYEMLHRLRGNKNDPATWRIPGVMPFDISDVADILKIHDYPKPFRDRLTALSYRVLTRVDIRRMVAEGVMTKAEAIESYQDMGYTVADATKLANFIIAALDTSRLKAARAGARAAIRDSYRIGIIDKPQARLQLYRLLALSASEISNFDSLTPAEQQQAADTSTLVIAELDVIDIELSKQSVLAGIAAIKRAFLRNQITPVVAQTQLLGIGINITRVTQYINTWTVLRWGQGKDVTAMKIVQWVCKGKITPPQGQSRLELLGYNAVDAALLISDGLTCAAELANKQAEKADKTLKEKSKLIDDGIKKASAAIKAAQAALAKHGTPAQLKKWFSEGIISEAETVARLALLGFPAIDAQRLLADPVLLPPGGASQLDAGIPIPSVPR